MLKRFLSVAVLALMAAGAEAAQVYLLNDISYENSFSISDPTFVDPTVCLSCGTGTAVDDGAGNITLSGLSWSFAGGGNEYSATINGTTTLAPTYTPVTSPAGALPAGSVLSGNTGTCTTVIFASTDPCNPLGYRSSWGVSVFRTGLTSSPAGTATCGQGINLANVDAINRCRVDLAILGTGELQMQIKRALSESAGTVSFQRLTFTFTPVPVPAGVWLFGSALGLLGLARRKFA